MEGIESDDVLGGKSSIGLASRPSFSLRLQVPGGAKALGFLSNYCRSSSPPFARSCLATRPELLWTTALPQFTKEHCTASPVISISMTATWEGYAGRGSVGVDFNSNPFGKGFPHLQPHLAIMGVCASCLGRGHERDREISDEVSDLDDSDLRGRGPSGRRYTWQREMNSCWYPFPQDESSRLLFDDPHGHHYGSFADQHAGTTQADPQEVQRETEALQKVVAQTSKYAFWRLWTIHYQPIYSDLPAILYWLRVILHTLIIIFTRGSSILTCLL